MTPFVYINYIDTSVIYSFTYESMSQKSENSFDALYFNPSTLLYNRYQKNPRSKIKITVQIIPDCYDNEYSIYYFPS